MQDSKAISKSQRRWLLCFFAVIIFISPAKHPAFAQQPDPTGQEELRQRTQREAQERQRQQQAQDIFLQAQQNNENNAMLPAEKISFTIHTFILEGNRVTQFPWANAFLEKYEGRKIGKEGINLIVKRLTNAFIRRGYVTTRISIPEQNLASGTLRLTLIPGVIRSIRFADADTYGHWQNAFPARPGDLLNIRDIEQGLEQMKRVPSQDADIKIAPGGKTGESDILITVKRDKPWRFTLSLDDSGSRATGKLQSCATFSLDNLLSLNDLFYISMNSDADRKGERKGTNGSSIYYSIPDGYWTMDFSFNRYEYHQTVQGSNQSFIYSGQNEDRELRIKRLVYRDQTSKTGLEFSIIKENSRSFVADTEIAMQRKDVTADELGITHRHYFGKTLLDIELAHRWGVPWFGAQPEQTDGMPGFPTTRYKLWKVDATITTPARLGRTEGKYTCNLRGQYTKDMLNISDQFSIGNRYTVRGFDGEQTLAAENGWLIQNELSVPVAKDREVYLGVDYGKVSGPSAVWLAGKSLAGAVLGLRGELGDLHYDLFTGCPLYKPEELQTANPVFGFQLTYQY
jgi:hemolysin activation/secretion protein